ncbi:MAG: type pilus assembly protein PilA [Blastocatellia bacterium]|jgi:competence protein ComGC|nr:type pilus assembly protein PilA [Blastocatellia bacterium]
MNFEEFYSEQSGNKAQPQRDVRRIVLLAVGIPVLSVLILLFIIWLVAFPGLQKSRMAANEASAVQSVRTITAAEAEYARAHPNEYGTFVQLINDGLLDKRFFGEKPVVSGYTFTLRVSQESDGQRPGYEVWADPQPNGWLWFKSTDAHHFYSSPASPMVRYNPTRAATAEDPALY